MTGRFLPICCAIIIAALAVLPAHAPAQTVPANQAALSDSQPATSLVVLRNGEVISGRVTQEKDRYIVDADGTEIRLLTRDVDFVCRSLDEAYIKQRDRISVARIEDRLRLVQWCIHHRLLGYAAIELATAMETNPRHPGIAVLEQRLRQAHSQSIASEEITQKDSKTDTIAAVAGNAASASEPASKAKKSQQPLSAADLDRFSRNLPEGTVEHFIEDVQPLLMNSCATVGCHGPSSKSKYGLIRPAANGKIAPRGLSQRNLFNTLEWLDHNQPLDSEFLKKAREPHGGKPVGVLAENSVQYRQLVLWVQMATGATAAPTGPATIELTAPGMHAQVGSPFQPSRPAPYVNAPAAETPPKPLEKPTEQKPFYEQPPAERKKKPYGV